MVLRVLLTRVEQDETIRPDQVDTASSGFTGEQEDKFFPFRVVELINKLLTFLDVRTAFQAEVTISVGYKISGSNTVGVEYSRRFQNRYLTFSRSAFAQ